MPTGLVFSGRTKNPATHAIIIGVGHYPHLTGGSSPFKYRHSGLGQLKSPSESALSLAKWIIERFECPDRPLGSVALLASDKKARTLTYQRDGGEKNSVKVPVASMSNVATAIREWRARGDAHPDSLMLFFFCGHGLASGNALALLMEDFGSDPNAPLNAALDFRRFHSGMEECVARQQCFFIDACRTNSELIERNQGYAGNPVMQWSGSSANPDGRSRLGPIFFSTLAQAKAYARTGKPSVFTQSLLSALSGAGSGDEDGPWQVKATRVQMALDAMMKEESRALDLPEEQIPSVDSMAEVVLNTVQRPSVPVYVRLDPNTAHAIARLSCHGPERRSRPRPTPKVWTFSVSAGQYDFAATFKKGAPYRDTLLADEPIRPPYWRKPFKVGR